MQRTAQPKYETILKHLRMNRKQRIMKNIPEIIVFLCVIIAAVCLAYNNITGYVASFSVMWVLFLRYGLFVTKK